MYPIHNIRIHRKYIVLFLYILFQQGSLLYASSLNIEKVNFYTEDSTLLEGLLCLPKYAPKKIVIYIPPLEEYNALQSVLKQPSTDTPLNIFFHDLPNAGIGVFTFSMRACREKDFSESIGTSTKYRAQTLNTLAEDAIHAYQFLRKDSRFSSLPIGVTGTSAVGRSAVMAAVKQTDISFVSIFSTPSTNNFDAAESSYANGSVNYVALQGLFSDLWSIISDVSFTYLGKEYTAPSSKELEQQFINCAWDCFKRINRTVIANCADYDSIQLRATTLMKESFRWKKKEVWRMPKGTPDNVKTPNEYIDLLMFVWHKPIDISFLRWNFEEWYPRLQCPTLFVFAEEDKIIDVKKSVINVKNIMKEFDKTNFTIYVLEGLNHSFQTKETFAGKKNTLNNLSQKYIQWLDQI